MRFEPFASSRPELASAEGQENPAFAISPDVSPDGKRRAGQQGLAPVSGALDEAPIISAQTGAALIGDQTDGDSVCHGESSRMQKGLGTQTLRMRQNLSP